MKTEDELRRFCTNELSEKYETLEQLRKKTSSDFYRLLIFSIVGGSLVGFYSLMLISPGGVAILFPFYILILIVIIVMLRNIRRRFYSVFKDEIISGIVKFYDKNLTYSPDKGIMSQAVEISRIFIPREEYEGRDYVEGQIGETFLQFSYAEFSNIGSTTGTKIFRGIFMIATFNKYFKGTYIVIPHNYRTTVSDIFNHALHKINDEMPEIIKMEDPDFNNYFTVYGTDQFEARYILTPAMMRRMLDFQALVGAKVYFSFTRSRLFLAFDSEGTSAFEPSLLSPIDINEITLWARQIGFAINVIDEFNLNTRIWSKR